MKSPEQIVRGDLALTRRHWREARDSEDRATEAACMRRLDKLLDRLLVVGSRSTPQPSHL